MPLRKKHFDRDIHADMKVPNVAARAGSSSETVDAEMDMKKRVPNTPDLEYEAEHEDYVDKKDHPPRFSTLFGVAPPPECGRRPEPRRRRSGVFIPMPIFVLFVIILAFESVLLFAYTVIGLYNNLPQRLVPAAGHVGACNCVAEDRQPAVNIAPNFMMPQVPAVITQIVTAPNIPTSVALSSTTSEAADLASELASVMHTLVTSTTSSSSSTSSPSTTSAPSIVTETVPPAQSTVNSTKFLTVTPAQDTTSVIRPTVTSILVLDPSQAAASSSVDAAILSSISAEESSIVSSINHLDTSTMTFVTSTSSSANLPEVVSPAATDVRSSTKSSAAPSSTAKEGKVCFGGAGAVQQNCV